MKAFQLIVGALAVSGVASLAPPSFGANRVPLASLTALSASTESHSVVHEHQPILDIPPMPIISCSDSSCNTETLDAEMDTFADPNDKRYSASDWFHNMRSLPNSAILREIRGPVGWIAAWSTLVSVVHKLCNMGGMGHIANRMCLGSTPHSLIASSIGLLLVFRTNSAYQRFRVSAAWPPFCTYSITSHIILTCKPTFLFRRDAKHGRAFSTLVAILQG